MQLSTVIDVTVHFMSALIAALTINQRNNTLIVHFIEKQVLSHF